VSKIGIDARELEGKPTGVGRYLRNLLTYWAKENSRDSLYLYSRSSLKGYPFLSSPQFHLHHFSSRLLQSGFYWEQFILPTHLKEDKVDLLFGPGYSLPFRLKCKGAVTIHDVSFEAHPEWFPPRERLRRRFLCRQAVRRADVVFAVSTFTKEEIIRYYRVPEGKIKVVYNCLDPNFRPIANSEQLASFRRKFNLTERTLLYAGAIFNRRGIPEVIKAFGEVVKKVPEITLVLVGENRTYPWIDLPALIANLSLENKVKLLGYVNDEDLLMLYNIAEIFIYLSSYEGFGLPPLEALACGTSLILQDIPATREVFGNTTTMLPRAEAPLIVEAIIELLGNKGKREEIVRRGAPLIKRFSYNNTARLTLEHLHKVLE